MAKKPTVETNPSEPAAPSTATRYVARRPMSYAGRPLDREQVFTLAQQPHDERLIRLGYVAVFSGSSSTCGACGAGFASVGALEAHGVKRHNPNPEARPVMLAQQPGESDYDYDLRRTAFEQQVNAHLDQIEMDEETRLDRQAPLNWEKTAASMAGA